ncbi:MAG: cell division protein ZapA [Janthinobacterium lividum]
MTTTKQIEVRILEQDYRLSCLEEDEAALRASAQRVNAEMNKVRNNSSVRGTDRIAVMAALSLASELNKLVESVRHGEAFPVEEIRRTIGLMNERIEAAVVAPAQSATSH